MLNQEKNNYLKMGSLNKIIIFFIFCLCGLNCIGQALKDNINVEQIMVFADSICKEENFTAKKGFLIGAYKSFNFNNLTPIGDKVDTLKLSSYYLVYTDSKNNLFQVSQIDKNNYYNNNDFYFYHTNRKTFFICYNYFYPSRKKNDMLEPGLWVAGFFLNYKNTTYFFAFERFYVNDGALPYTTLYAIMTFRNDLYPLQRLRVNKGIPIFKTRIVYDRLNRNTVKFEFLEMFNFNQKCENIGLFSLLKLKNVFNTEEVIKADNYFENNTPFIFIARIVPDWDDDAPLWQNGMYQYK